MGYKTSDDWALAEPIFESRTAQLSIFVTPKSFFPYNFHTFKGFKARCQQSALQGIGMENLKIYIDRLKNGQTQKIEESLSPEFLEIDEEDLVFDDPIILHGEAYIANEDLVIQLNIDTFVYLPCSICNDAVHTPITIKNIYLTRLLSEIPSAIFDLTEEIRESILLQTPLFAECNQGRCPERENIRKFLKNEQDIPEIGDKPHYNFPFADLDK
jgi:uncharacterized metal-binding protein YceD (DUF177 family)